MKKRLSISLLIMMPFLMGAFPTTGILDNFNRANEGPPPSASWTNVENGLEVVSNACEGDAAASSNWSNWIGAGGSQTFGPNCECYCTIGDADPRVFARLTVKDNTVTDGYCIITSITGNSVKIYRLDNGGFTQLGDTISQVITADASDKIGIEIVGTTISAYFDDGGAGWGSIGSEIDANHDAAGYVGARVYPHAVNFDDFGGGTIAAADGAGQVITILLGVILPIFLLKRCYR